MKCSSPKFIKKYDMDVPCGKCGACLQRWISDWTIRCKCEMRKSLAGWFVTLTYERDPIQLYKSDVQRFIKRCRKVGFRFSYLLVGDYGDTYGRPHYHVCFFVKGYFEKDYLHSLWISGRDQIRRRGFVHVKPLTEGRITYAVRYGKLAKLDWNKDDGRQSPFFLMSKRPALGSGYIFTGRQVVDIETGEITRELRSDVARFFQENDCFYFPDGRFKKPLPRYFRDFLFSEELRIVNRARVSRKVDEAYRLELARLSKFTPNAVDKLRENLVNESDLFLQGLRLQKQLKNKLL